MAEKTVPESYHTVTPYLIVDGVLSLIDFLKQTFGAEVNRAPKARPDGSIMHAEVRIGDSVIMMGEPMDEWPPMPAHIYLYVDDADAAYDRALQAGATSLMEPADQSHGDRFGIVEDASGNQWTMASPITQEGAQD